MPPRLAREAVTAAALRGDTAALLSASAYLPAREAFRYDRRRAAAFTSALAGDRELALHELGLGGGVRSVRLGLDTAVVELLTRGALPAVEAVRLALRDGAHGEPDVPLVLAECVRHEPDTARAALGVALGGGTMLERTRAAAAVVGAAPFGRLEAAVPAVAAISVAVAVVAFLRLPGLIAGEETATPTLPAPRPAVVVAQPPAEPVAPPRPKPRPRAEATIQVAVRSPVASQRVEPRRATPASAPASTPTPSTPPRSTPPVAGPVAPAPPAPLEPAPSAPAPPLAAAPPAATAAQPEPPPPPAEAQATWQSARPVDEEDDRAERDDDDDNEGDRERREGGDDEREDDRDDDGDDRDDDDEDDARDDDDRERDRDDDD